MLIGNSQGIFVPKDDDDKYVVYKCGSDGGLSPYSISLALDRIRMQQEAHPDLQYIVSDARHISTSPSDPMYTFLKDAYQSARVAGVIVLHAAGNTDMKIDANTSMIPQARSLENSVMGHTNNQAFYPYFTVPTITNRSDASELAFING